MLNPRTCHTTIIAGYFLQYLKHKKVNAATNQAKLLLCVFHVDFHKILSFNASLRFPEQPWSAGEGCEH